MRIRVRRRQGAAHRLRTCRRSQPSRPRRPSTICFCSQADCEGRCARRTSRSESWRCRTDRCRPPRASSAATFRAAEQLPATRDDAEEVQERHRVREGFVQVAHRGHADELRHVPSALVASASGCASALHSALSEASSSLVNLPICLRTLSRSRHVAEPACGRRGRAPGFRRAFVDRRDAHVAVLLRRFRCLRHSPFPPKTCNSVEHTSMAALGQPGP